MEEGELLNRMAKRIREIRESKGLSQMDVASAAGMDKSAYQRIERGGANITIKILNNLLLALDEKLSAFFESVES